MKISHMVVVVLLTGSTACAHHIDELKTVHYAIKPSTQGLAAVKFDLTHGIVHATDPDGSIRQIGRAHMSRATPWDAQQVFGQITIDVANELAGTWYIYR